MNDDIATLDFALVMKQFDALFRVDAEQRRKLKDCTPVNWDTTPRHCEDISHDCA